MEYDDIDFEEQEIIEQPQNNEEIIETSTDQEVDIIGTLLNDRGISDRTKISFETEDGQIQELNWDNLSSEEQLNILRTSTPSAEDGLDEIEINFINQLRGSNLTPQEYIEYIQNQAVETYKQSLSSKDSYTIDSYSDDELFVLDLKERIKDISDEEVDEALNRAKANESLYVKQINSLRNEYRQLEDENNKQTQLYEQQQAQQRYNQFAKSIQDEVINFNSIADGNLNMSNEDKQQLYEFITGFDQAGNSWFGKALNDPNTVVKMAWFALNGEQAIQDIQDYYNSEIIKIKRSYEPKKPTPNIIYKPKSSNQNNTFDDIDDEF